MRIFSELLLAGVFEEYSDCDALVFGFLPLASKKRSFSKSKKFYTLQLGNAFPGLFFHSRESGMCKRLSRHSRAPGNKEMHGGTPVLPNGQRARRAIVYV